MKPEKTIRFQTVGCRLNQYESEKMAAELYPYGFRRALKNEKAEADSIQKEFESKLLEQVTKNSQLSVEFSQLSAEFE